jgi:hypothetical protein
MTTKFPRANVSKTCCAVGCKRVAVQAERLSDFWVSRCAPCSKKEITLDFAKIMGDKNA